MLPSAILCLFLGLCIGRASAIAGAPEIIGTALVKETNSADEFAAKYQPLEKWLEQKDLTTCLANTRADILFAVDGSESVSLTDFHLVVKSVLVDTISRLEIGENFVQVGVLVFSSQVTQSIPIGRYSNKLDLLRAVSRLTYDGSYTVIDAAVEGCIAELGRRLADAPNATNAAEMADRKRIVIFVTDGRHTDSFSLYLREMLGQLHRRVTAVMTLSLLNFNQPMLLQLATDPTLVFDPTAYTDYQASLYNLLSMRCSGTCYKYENQAVNIRKVISTLVQYTNYLINNFASYHKQQTALADYSRSVNESVVSIENDIEATCNADDNGLLRRIVTLEDRIRTETNGSKFSGFSIDTYVTEMIQKISIIQKEVFDQSQTLATEKTKMASTVLQEERLTTDFQARLESKISIRKMQEQSLAILESRIESYRKEITSVTQSLARFENITVELSSRLTRQESVYTSRQTQLNTLTQEYTTLLALQNGGDQQLTIINRRLDLCLTQMRDGNTVLFAIRCGSGAAFQTLFSREDTTFSELAFEGLGPRLPVYKSPFLRNLHTMGYFSSVTWLFLDTRGVELGSITMDTSRFELSSLFNQARVVTSFPWIASYVNSIYSASLTQFRPKVDAEFFLVFGDLTKYHLTGSCADIVGVFLVLTGPHRCYPESAGTLFPLIYVSESPFGGLIRRPVAELRLITGRLPGNNRPMPTRTVNEEQLTEILLYAKTGAGYLHSLLLTSQYTPAALLADVDDLSQLARHYKSSMLANLNLKNYRAIKLELFDRSGRVLAALRFKGPFNQTVDTTRRQVAGSLEIGTNADKWAWFQAKYLDSAEPFDIQLMRNYKFTFYNGIEFFAITDKATSFNCSENQYFLTLIDSASPCECFGNHLTPAIFFSDDRRPSTCDNMKIAESLRLTGELERPMNWVARSPSNAGGMPSTSDREQTDSKRETIKKETIKKETIKRETTVKVEANATASVETTKVHTGPDGTTSTEHNQAKAAARAIAGATGKGDKVKADASASASVRDGSAEASSDASASGGSNSLATALAGAVGLI